MRHVRRRSVLSTISLATIAPRVAFAQAPTPELKFTFGTSVEGGSFMIYALALLDALRTVDPSLEIASVPTKGTAENVPKLEAGELDVAMVSGEFAYELFMGIGRPVSKLKVVTAMYSTPGMFAVRADSRYRSIADLKGRPVVWNARGSGLAVQARYMLDGLGLDPDRDFQAIYPETLAEGPAMLIEGTAAALWGGGLRWPGFVEVASNPRGARFVVPNAQEIAAIRAKHSFLKPVVVPAGLYSGQYDAIETVGAWSYVLARDGLDDAAGYRLAADLYRIERVGTLSRQLTQSTVKNTLASLPSPDLLQPGVRRFYKDNGLLP
ncbi:MAG: TAXI family TRAP transporter solute-binding subunit [Proteobacteria bacterium]|nr:TAXI family TRAP transporter solute-binding subunit [Pseudomonadota bacterium]